MKFWDIINTANANLLRNKSRSLLTILAIVVGSFTIILTTGINQGVNNYIDKQISSIGGEGYFDQIVKTASANSMSSMGLGGMSQNVTEYNPNNDSAAASVITKADLSKIAAVKGIKNVQPLQTLTIDYITAPSAMKKYVITAGVMPSSTIRVDLASGRMVNLNGDRAEIVLPDKYVKPLGFTNSTILGQKVELAVTNQLTNQSSIVEATVMGVANPTVIGFGRAWINAAAGDQIYAKMTDGLPAQYRDQIYLASAQLDKSYYGVTKTDDVKSQLKKLGFTATTVDDEVGMLKTLFNAITVVLLIFGVIALVAASIGIINTLFMSVQERTREIGLMKAMGLSRGKIFLIFSFEAVALGFWGAAIGIGLAYLTKAWANPWATHNFLSGLPGFTLIEFSPLALAIIVIIIMTIAFLAGTVPAWRAAQKDPIESLRYE